MLESNRRRPKIVALFTEAIPLCWNQTCVGDGLCSTSCPMEINTGDLIHELRSMKMPPGSFGYTVGKFASQHFSLVKNGLRLILSITNTAQVVAGTKIMSWKGRMLHKVFCLPLWTPAMPRTSRLRQPNSSLITRHSKPSTSPPASTK